MSRRQIAVSVDLISRAIKGTQKAGIEIRTIRVEPSGAIVINGDSGESPEKMLATESAGYL